MTREKVRESLEKARVSALYGNCIDEVLQRLITASLFLLDETKPPEFKPGDVVPWPKSQEAWLPKAPPPPLTIWSIGEPPIKVLDKGTLISLGNGTAYKVIGWHPGGGVQVEVWSTP